MRTHGIVDWSSLRELPTDVLKNELFNVIEQTSGNIQAEELDDPHVLTVVPRLAELIEARAELKGFKEVCCALARSVGLWNYIDQDVADARDRFAAQMASVPEFGIVLHREQMNALNALLRGENLILSAPTSFGKSVLIDVLLLQERYRRVAVVLPTIALLDEFRRRLVKRFGDKFDVLMHHSEKVQRDRVIFLGTQERLINRDDLGTLDLVVVDEFYKLDPARKDERSVTLNAAVYKLLNRARQFFFLGPNIEHVHLSNESRWRFSFLRTRFATVAVDTYNLNGIADKEARLREEIVREANWPALVFVSSPDKANQLAAEIVGHGYKVGDGEALAEWMVTYYGARWSLSDAVAAGIGVHHGRIPRALASRFVKLFNDRILPVLVCTSTLIEGVNTAAKTVLIYDKNINNRPYDFFTFSNIRGRAGRLGEHHVGQVFLFHTPPSEEEVDVTAPLFGDLEDAPDEFVIHVTDDDTNVTISTRVDEIVDRVGLEPDELRRFSAFGVDKLVDLREQTARAIASRTQIVWSGWPSYDEIRAVCNVICAVASPREFGVTSANQLTMYINKLRSAGTMREFFRWHSQSYRGAPVQIDNVFKFLRAAEYSLPEYFSAIELFLQKLGQAPNYALLVGELPRWFRAEALKILEEQGVPIQISERFLAAGDSVTSLGGRLRELARSRSPRLSALEHAWILDALPD